MNDSIQTKGRRALSVLAAAKAELASLDRPVTRFDVLAGRTFAADFDRPALSASLADLDALIADGYGEQRVHINGTPPTVVDVPVSTLRAELAAVVARVAALP